MKTDNPFLTIAFAAASRIAGSRYRIVLLASQLALRFRHIRWTEVNLSSMRKKLETIGRLIIAHGRGHYRVRSMRMFIIIIAAVVYFLNPIDLIPDFIVGLGLTDDLAVLTWVYQAAREELIAFEQWEKISGAPLDTAFTIV